MNNISAILGPTNTGKTFFAIKKMLKCDNGVIGFPLRLLARENYEYTKRIVGESKVALKTGDEKIIDGIINYISLTFIPNLTRFVGRLQTGFIYHYAFAIFIGLVSILTYFLVSMGG